MKSTYPPTPSLKGRGENKKYTGHGILTASVTLLLLFSSPEAQTKRAPLRDVMRGITVHYNRAEGMYGGYQLKLAPKIWQGGSIWVETGYGLESDTFRWAAGMGIERPDFGIRFSTFDRTETEDHDIVSTAENTFFALLFKGDYRDYFRAKNGFETTGRYRLRPRLDISGTLTVYTYESMPTVATWSILKSDDTFRPNPPVTPGKIGRFYLGLIYDTRRRLPRFYNAWHIRAFYERGFREFPLDGLHLTAARHQKTIWGNQAFILRARLASRTHTAEQFLFDLGGVGTLRGFGIKEFSGNRMLMFNIDYLFRGDLFKHIPIPASHLFNFVLFADTGWTDIQPRGKNFLSGFSPAINDFKTNVGLAIGITERLFRFNIARRLDRSHDAWTFSARFFREF